MYISIRADTSLIGRFQFSRLEEYSVRKSGRPCSSRRRAHSVTIGLTHLTPCLCPQTRSSPRCTAQRPLPSMMMAMWTGIFSLGMSDRAFIQAQCSAPEANCQGTAEYVLEEIRL